MTIVESTRLIGWRRYTSGCACRGGGGRERWRVGGRVVRDDSGGVCRVVFVARDVRDDDAGGGGRHRRVRAWDLHVISVVRVWW